MPSVLLPGGSTRAWRKLRAEWAEKLAERGAIPCWRCRKPIVDGSSWHLGHREDRALGGNDSNLALEHSSCSTSAGATLGNRLRADPDNFDAAQVAAEVRKRLRA